MNYVDAHHHIWPAEGLPWLDGPMIPRIFGPYEPLRGRAYTAEEYIADATANGFGQSVYVQANWRLEDSLEEVEWVHAQHERTGWPHAIVGSADLFDANAFETLQAQQAASPLMRGTRLQLHWHEHEAFRFAGGPERAQDPTFNANIARLPELGYVFELQVFPNQLASALRARRRPPGRHVRADPRRNADRRRALARRADRALTTPERERQALRPGDVRPRSRPRADRAMSPKSFSTRSAPAARCSARTSRSRAYGPTFLAL